MIINRNSYICSLDIGSSKISATLAQIKKKRLSSLEFESAASKGVKGGVIVDSIELIGVISKLMKTLKARTGVNIKNIYANISGQDIVTKRSHAIIPLAERGNKVITQSDIEVVNEQARILGSSLEEEIIQIIPSSYTIDSKNNIINPFGLYSHKLEVDLYLICGKLSSIQSLARVVHQSGYEIKDLFFSGLATSKAVFNKELNEGLNLFCDIGSDIVELLVFKDGFLKDMEIMSFGGDDLTQKLSDELKIPFDLAEEIKKSYGIIGDVEQIEEGKEILVKKSELYKPIKQKLVSQIITLSAKDICSKIKDSVIKKVAPHEVNNFIITGRTLLLEGFIETLENTLSMPVKLGRIRNEEVLALTKEGDSLSGQKYLNYLTSLGMICEVLQRKPISMQPIHQPAKNLLAKVKNKLVEVYQEYF
ncbi:MAG: cell division protein FtsA [Candidatus Omnitrophota bacterium]|jgi:cell division protein FtsA